MLIRCPVRNVSLAGISSNLNLLIHEVPNLPSEGTWLLKFVPRKYTVMCSGDLPSL